MLSQVRCALAVYVKAGAKRLGRTYPRKVALPRTFVPSFEPTSNSIVKFLTHQATTSTFWSSRQPVYDILCGHRPRLKLHISYQAWNVCLSASPSLHYQSLNLIMGQPALPHSYFTFDSRSDWWFQTWASRQTPFNITPLFNYSSFLARDAL